MDKAIISKKRINLETSKYSISNTELCKEESRVLLLTLRCGTEYRNKK
jgi:hypothetical protein